MSPIHPIASKFIGVLMLIISLLVIARELKLWAGVESVLVVPVILLVLVLTLNVTLTRQAFVLVALLLSVINLLWNPSWQATLTSGFSTAAFIVVFFGALTTLKFAAETSPSIQNCGRFLSQQPPGRRYAALTVGGQLFGLLLNYGSISLLGSMTMANASLERNEEIRNHRIRRMLLAIQRGFISTLPWSPLSFAVAIPTSLIPGSSWALCVFPGLVNGAIMAGMGWLLDTLFKPKLSSPLPARQPVQGNWFSVMPLVLLLVLLVSLLGGAYLLTGVRVLALVMIIVPLLSMAWIALQTREDHPLKQVGRRASDYLMHQLSGFRSEMILLMMAGYIGTVASPLLGSLMAFLHIDLAALPSWLVLVILVWFIPMVGQIGMNPILAVALITPVLPAATTLGVSPTSIVVALTAGWILSGVSSPFTATTMLVGNFAGISSFQVGRKWNGVYTILCAAILSAWVVVYAIFF